MEDMQFSQLLDSVKLARSQGAFSVDRFLTPDLTPDQRMKLFEMSKKRIEMDDSLRYDYYGYNYF